MLCTDPMNPIIHDPAESRMTPPKPSFRVVCQHVTSVFNLKPLIGRDQDKSMEVGTQGRLLGTKE